MANLKISQLTAGAPAQAADIVPIDRAGANFSLKVSDISAQILNSPQVLNSITTGINAMGSVSGAVAMNLALGNVITMTLTGNVTSSTFSNAVASAGEEVTFIITQNGTGGYTFAWPTAVVPLGLNPAPSIGANSVTIFKGVVDGSGNVNWVQNGAIPVFRQKVGGLTASNNSYFETYTVTLAGRFRLTTTLSCTTAGASGSTMAVNTTTLFNANNGVASPACLNLTTNYQQSCRNEIYVSTGNVVNSATGWYTTLSGTIGAAVYEVDFLVEYMGN